jgi:hypothetical protein
VPVLVIASPKTLSKAIIVDMLKLHIAAAALILSAILAEAVAAQPDPLGAIWREGATDNKAWIVGTIRSVEDLDQLLVQEKHPENGADAQKPLHDTFLRFEAECSDDDFAVRVKASAFGQEPPKIESQTPYSFEDSPLREASVIVNGQSALNLHYLWGAMSGTSVRADDRLSLAGSAYRFLTQIGQLPKSEIRLFTPKGSAAYLLDRSYQESTNSEAINEFEQKCAKFASNWH